MGTRISFSEFYDDNGETSGFAIRIGGHEGYGVFYPCGEPECVAGTFCGMEIEAEDMYGVMKKISQHPLVAMGSFEVDTV